MSLPQPPAPPVTMECYRHPGRPAYRRCRRCGKPTCEECLVSTDLGAMCVECARQGRPDARTRARYWSARQPTLVTYVLIGLNVAIFTLVALDDPSTLTGGGALRPAPGLQQYDLGLSKGFLVYEDGWYRIVSSGFLHFGIIHLAFNMLLLYQLGQVLEPVLGRTRFALLYFAALLGGSAGVLLLQPNAFSGGASGAGALVIAFASRPRRSPVATRRWGSSCASRRRPPTRAASRSRSPRSARCRQRRSPGWRASPARSPACRSCRGSSPTCPLPSRESVAWMVYLGLFPTAIGFTTWAYALRRTTAGRLGSTTYLVPPIVIVMSLVVLGEVPPMLSIAGGVLCIAGVIVARSRGSLPWRRATTAEA